MKSIFKCKKRLLYIFISLVAIFFIFKGAYYFDPQTGIYFQYPEGQGLDTNYSIEQSGSSVSIVMNYRPKGQNHDFPAISIVKGWDESMIQGSSSLQRTEIKIGDRRAKIYYSGNKYNDSDQHGLILIYDPKISLGFELINGQASIPFSFVQEIAEQVNYLY